MCKIVIKCQYASRAVCAYAHVFQKRPGCALIGACALIRTNTVCNNEFFLFGLPWCKVQRNALDFVILYGHVTLSQGK